MKRSFHQQKEQGFSFELTNLAYFSRFIIFCQLRANPDSENAASIRTKG
jgi:hypothetical protein